MKSPQSPLGPIRSQPANEKGFWALICSRAPFTGKPKRGKQQFSRDAQVEAKQMSTRRPLQEQQLDAEAVGNGHGVEHQQAKLVPQKPHEDRVLSASLSATAKGNRALTNGNIFVFRLKATPKKGFGRNLLRRESDLIKGVRVGGSCLAWVFKVGEDPQSAVGHHDHLVRV